MYRTLFFLPDRFQTGEGGGGGGEKRNEKCSLSRVAMHPFSLLSFFSFFLLWPGDRGSTVFFFFTITSFLSRIKDGEVFSFSFLSIIGIEKRKKQFSYSRE